jgi:signal transduction histidine kinase
LATNLVIEERTRRELEAARRRLVASVSHDLCTPLASLRLLVESIDDGVVTGEPRGARIWLEPATPGTRVLFTLEAAIK